MFRKTVQAIYGAVHFWSSISFYIIGGRRHRRRRDERNLGEIRQYVRRCRGDVKMVAVRLGCEAIWTDSLGGWLGLPSSCYAVGTSRLSYGRRFQSSIYGLIFTPKWMTAYQRVYCCSLFCIIYCHCYHPLYCHHQMRENVRTKHRLASHLYKRHTYHTNMIVMALLVADPGNPTTTSGD